MSCGRIVGRGVLVLATAAVALMFAAPRAWAAEANAAPTGAKLGPVVDRGIAYLQGAQAEDGSFSAQVGPAVTALAAAAMIENGRTPADPAVAKALKYVEGHVKPDGGIYAEGSKYRNYETCLAIMCFKAANADGKYTDLLKRAGDYVKEAQWDVAEGYEEPSEYYGGAGYGGHNRPDLSNTSFLIDTLHSLDTPADDEAIQRALVFVSRCQNLETEHNQTKFAALINDGGFYYTIAAGGSSMAGAEPNGGLRSYGSMTYAGLKSMLYAGVDKDDQRVKAAVEWARNHYTLEENPGMGEAGLYYYYHTFAKAMKAMGQPTMTDDEGVEHDWRQEMLDALAARQQPDGSWLNKTDRWMESDPNLVTGYALLALSYCREK